MKYELTAETKHIVSPWGETEIATLYRIRALKSFGDVKAGDLGGFVESERNLSQAKTCWIGGDACVWDHGEVVDDAIVTDLAQVCDSASISGNARVAGYAKIRDWAMVSQGAVVREMGRVSGHAWVCGQAIISDTGLVSEHSRVHGNAWIAGNAEVSGNSEVSGNAWIIGQAGVGDYAKVRGRVTVFQDADVSGDGLIESKEDVLTTNQFKFFVTVLRQHIQIGCKRMTHEGWSKVSLKEAVRMGLPDDQYDAMQLFLITLPDKFKSKGECLGS